ncbi:MAG: RNA methyltransferase [Planctomycetes bacterium]|nr:RNA methyltransferase [Planctomycetota bacterium]
MSFEVITSPSNPRVKWAASLRDARDRKREGCIVIDGASNIEHAIAGGVECVELFLAERLELFLADSDNATDSRNASQRRHPGASNAYEWRKRFPGLKITLLGPQAMSKLQYGDRDLGEIAVAKMPDTSIATLNQRIASRPSVAATDAPQLFLVLDRMEKPGNLGAILRTADAAGATAVLLSDPVCEIWNPNAIRSSLGAIFRVPIGVGREPEIREWLEGRGVSIFAARADAGVDYSVVPYPNRTALVVGSEAFGLENRWSDLGVSSVHIPMGGVIDSLNASVSGSILVFEVIRQWRHTTKF